MDLTTIRTQFRSWRTALVSILLLLATASAAFAVEPVGQALRAVETSAFGRGMLASGDEVFLGDEFSVGRYGTLTLLFNDDSTLTLTPGSLAKIAPGLDRTSTRYGTTTFIIQVNGSYRWIPGHDLSLGSIQVVDSRALFTPAKSEGWSAPRSQQVAPATPPVPPITLGESGQTPEERSEALPAPKQTASPVTTQTPPRPAVQPRSEPERKEEAAISARPTREVKQEASAAVTEKNAAVPAPREPVRRDAAPLVSKPQAATATPQDSTAIPTAPTKTAAPAASPPPDAARAQSATTVSETPSSTGSTTGQDTRPRTEDGSPAESTPTKETVSSPASKAPPEGLPASTNPIDAQKRTAAPPSLPEQGNSVPPETPRESPTGGGAATPAGAPPPSAEGTTQPAADPQAATPGS